MKKSGVLVILAIVIGILVYMFAFQGDGTTEPGEGDGGNTPGLVTDGDADGGTDGDADGGTDGDADGDAEGDAEGDTE
tara:strand:- start:1641 stop:1874 length:234 start_codon:yes stop_codon:yes gene_type:complete